MNFRNRHLRVLGLVRNPFPPTPDAGSYFWTPYLEEQVSEIEQCVLARKGISLVTAEVGMGKSTLVRLLVERLSTQEFEVALVFNTFLQGPQLLAAVLHDFGLTSQASVAADIEQLNAFLLQSHAANKTCLLVLDDAQNLDPSSLELVRLLCNLETDQEKLLQILLVGQPELEQTLAQHSLRQLRSRLVKHTRLFGLRKEQLADYVHFRLQSAGAGGRIDLQPKACALLWQKTQGVPRQVHLVLDRCLYGLVAHDSWSINAALVQQALVDCQCEWTLDGAALPANSALRSKPKRAHGVRRLALAASLGIAALAWVLLTTTQDQLVHILALFSQAQATDRGAAQDWQPMLPAQVKQATPALAGEAAVQLAFCASEHTWPAGLAVRSEALSAKTAALFEAHLARLPYGCVFQRDGQTWLSWPDSAAALNVSDSARVKRIQQGLFQFGSLAEQDVDGWWGARSLSAMQNFQNAAGLNVTQAPDSLTVLLLEQFYASQS